MKKAFTLAEILITMGIVGVVSAMTIPALNQSWQRDSYVTQLRKVYSEVAQAAVRCKTDNNVQSLKEARLSNNNIGNKFFKQYFNITNDCGTTYANCFASEYKLINGGKLNMANTFNNIHCKYAVTIASGASLCAAWNSATARINILVDVNGQKDPNIVGRDLFFMIVDKNGVVKDPTITVNNVINESYPPDTNGALNDIMKHGWKMTY